MFVCECGQEISNKSGYVTHKKYCDETDIETETYRCSCGDKFEQKAGLINHEKWCSESNRNPPKINYVECSLCNLKVDSRSLSRHRNSENCKRRQLKNKRIESGKVCENCEENKAEDFGKSSTGRFCSKVCARSYGTKKNREKINQKISESLKNRSYEDRRIGYYKECPICEEDFYVTECNSDKIFCSRKCYLDDKDNFNYHDKTSGGLRKNSTIKNSCVYKDQKMDSGAELKFAKLLDNNNILWSKNEQDTFFEYEGVNGKNRKYYPDFFLKELNFWVEIKSEYYQTENLNKKIDSVPNIKLVYIDEIESFVNSLE